MGTARLGRRAALAATAATMALAAHASAATTYAVSGTQTVVDEAAGTARMSGGLIGDWANTSFTPLATHPIFRARGTERFVGCLDRGRDGSCAHDPSGTLRFSFRYWAQADEADALLWGACWHPVRGGTGAFAQATGVLVMADTPTATGVETAYIGTINLRPRAALRARRAARAAVARAGGAMGGCGPEG